MNPLFLILIIVFSVILLFVLIMYLTATKFLNSSFNRWEFVEGEELLSYNDVKDKYNRDEYEFLSKKKKLKAYLYKGNNDSLIIYAHGMCPGHQGYLSDIIHLIDLGYNVFTYDFTGTGSSEGKHYCGLNQQYFDLLKAISFVKNNHLFGYKHVHLYGHSMGGYAVACMNDPIINSIVSISGFDSPIEELLSVFGKNQSKMVIFFVKLMLKMKYFIDFGNKGNLKAHKILKNSNINTLIIQGNNDELVDYLHQSIYSKKDLINNEKIKFLLIEDENHNKHNTIIASTECVKYQKPFIDRFNQALKEGKSNYDAKQEMIKEIDRFKFNVANDELMDLINDFYQDNQ